MRDTVKEFAKAIENAIVPGYNWETDYVGVVLDEIHELSEQINEAAFDWLTKTDDPTGKRLRASCVNLAMAAMQIWSMVDERTRCNRNGVKAC